MIRQVFRSLSVWFFENRDLQPLRLQASRLLQPYWPRRPQAVLPFVTRYENSGAVWRELKTTVDINPGSGELFVEGARSDAASTVDALLPKGAADLLCYLFPSRIRREPSLILYAGADVSASGFVAGLVSRFFALDEANLPQHILLLVNMEMGRTRRFQDALSDQLFQPRPIELMRRHRLVQVEELHDVDATFLAPEHYERARERIQHIYGPFTTGGPAVVLCSDAETRASLLMRQCPTDVRASLGSDYVVLDADNTPLRILMQQLAAARLVVVPEGDEVSLLALLPNKQPPIVELALDRPRSKLAEQIRATARL